MPVFAVNDAKTVNRRLPNSHARGFTLLEVLVALLILSVGLLGIAELQLTSLRSNYSAYLRSQATILAYDILERIRANRAQAQAGAYNITIKDESDLPTGSTPADIDLKKWGNALLALLPAAQATVQVNADNTASIKITWDDSRAKLSGPAVAKPTVFEFQTRL